MNSALAPPTFRTFRFSNFKLAWAGAAPEEHRLAFGSVDGAVLFSDMDGHEIGERLQLFPMGAAINGLAWLADAIAITTVDQIAIITHPMPPSSAARIARIEHGAHGVIAIANQFVAPIGHDGFMTINPSYASATDYQINAFQGDSPNFYQLCALPAYSGLHYCVAACRDQGVGTLDFKSTADYGFSIGTYNSADVVDVVYLGNESYPYAIGAIGAEGEILLCRDIIRKEPPVTLRYSNFNGTVYRMVSAFGHLIVLTSKCLYVLGNLANRLVQPTFDKSIAPVLTIELAGVDASIVDGRWLLVVMKDGVRQYDMAEIHQRIIDFPNDEPIPNVIEMPCKEWPSRELVLAS